MVHKVYLEDLLQPSTLKQVTNKEHARLDVDEQHKIIVDNTKEDSNITLIKFIPTENVSTLGTLPRTLTTLNDFVCAIGSPDNQKEYSLRFSNPAKEYSEVKCLYN